MKTYLDTYVRDGVAVRLGVLGDALVGTVGWRATDGYAAAAGAQALAS